jgi:hypothetical protein
LKSDSKISHLISCGTAICGGSAIAAIAPVIQSDEKTDFGCLRRHFYPELNRSVVLNGNRALATFNPAGFGRVCYRNSRYQFSEWGC